jgi:hypothetical protein
MNIRKSFTCLTNMTRCLQTDIQTYMCMYMYMYIYIYITYINLAAYQRRSTRNDKMHAHECNHRAHFAQENRKKQFV